MKINVQNVLLFLLKKHYDMMIYWCKKDAAINGNPYEPISFEKWLEKHHLIDKS